MTRLSILALVLLTGCCCNDACQPEPQTCIPSGPAEFEKVDGVWWVTISGPVWIEESDGQRHHLDEGESMRVRVSPEIAAKLERREAP